MSIAYTIQKLFWCFPNQFLLILDWVQAISNFLREKNAETWDNSIGILRETFYYTSKRVWLSKDIVSICSELTWISAQGFLETTN